MGYNKKDLIEQALKVIPKQNVMFIEELSEWLGISRATVYNKKLHEVDEVKDAIQTQRTKTLQSLRKKWHDSDAPGTQIALYKLICSQEDLEKLGGKQKLELSGDIGIRLVDEAE